MNSSRRWNASWPERSIWTRIGACLLALVLAWQFPAPAIGQQGSCKPAMVAVAPQQPGNPLTGDIVQLVDTGSTVMEVPFVQPKLVLQSPRAGTAIVRSLGNLHSLLDVTSGAITPIQIPLDDQLDLSSSAPSVRNASQSDFMLFANHPETIWLVDLRNGQARELSSFLPDQQAVEAASISPGGQTLLIYSQNRAYIVSLATPDLVIPLDSEPVLAYPGFSADGTAVLYATVDANRTATVHSLDLDSGIRADLGTAPNATAFDANQGDLPLIIDRTSLRVLRPGDAVSTRVFSWTGANAGLIADTSGRHLLVGDEFEGRTHWFWIDLSSGQSQEATALEGMAPLMNDPIQDATLFISDAAQGPGTPGVPYRTIDLVTGTVATPLIQDSSEVWMASAAGDNAGRYFFVNAVSPGAGRMWLVDTADGTATLIGTSSGNLSARVSPDGCHLATAVFDTLGEGRTSTVSVTSLQDGSTSFTLPNTILLGWAELPATVTR